MGTSVAFAKTRKDGFHTIFQELAIEDCEGFCEFMRMPHAKFAPLAVMLSESIKKQDTHMRMPIPPRERLARTLRFLVTGESFQSLFFQFQIGKATVGEIVMEVCEAIYHAYRKERISSDP